MKNNLLASSVFFLVLGAALYSGPAKAAHPLITDDAETQGRGRTQIELNASYGWDKETAAGVEEKEKALALESVVSYGVTDSLDAILVLPYVSVGETIGGLENRESGLTDISAGVKWRFWEREHLSLAFKPAVIMPTGDENKGLGAGKYGYEAFLIATQETEPWEFHLNAGYVRNNNKFDERENICHLSLAVEFEFREHLTLVANIGQERSPEKTEERKAAFALVGIIYGLSEDLDIDAGLEAAISDPETDATVLAGMAWRF